MARCTLESFARESNTVLVFYLTPTDGNIEESFEMAICTVAASKRGVIINATTEVGFTCWCGLLMLVFSSSCCFNGAFSRFLKLRTLEWKKNLPHGQGSRTWPDGSKYTGQWKAGKYHGSGMFFWPTGKMYAGEWHSGMKHGKLQDTNNNDNFCGTY
jgi:hypothetical protein